MKAVQFTIEPELLRRVDADPEVKAHGRSAFLRAAIEELLMRKRTKEIRDAYRRGYGTKAVAPGEFETENGALVWPDE
jgi:metal-responsive CopG/Arc/MetJ family transcriptional regulator